MRQKAVVLLLVAGLTISTGAGVASRATAQTPDLVVIAQSQDIVTGDPHKTAEVASYNVLTNIYDTLIARDAELRLKPGLATSWRALDPTTWEFALRRGVRFHNGEPFNANVVKYSFERALDPNTKWPSARLFRLMKSVTVIDDYTVRVTMERPWPFFLTFVAYLGFIVPPRYLEQNGQEALVRRPVGTGPYKFVRWVKDDRIELEANSAYWGGEPRIGRVIVRVIPTESTRLAELLSGAVHLINIVPPEVFGPINRSSRAKLVSGRSTGFFYIQFNLLNISRDRPLADKRVRQALNYAVDRKALIDSIMRGVGDVVATFCTDGVFGCDPSISPFPYDPGRARTLLREAGYPNGFDMTVSSTSNVYPADLDLSMVVADQLASVGARTRVVVNEQGAHLRQLFARKAPEDALFRRSSDWSGFPWQIGFTNFHGRGVASFWANQEFDQLLDTAEATLDEARAKDIYRRAQILFKDEAPAITLFTAPNAYGLHRDLEWTPRPDLRLPMFDASWKRR